MATKKEKEQGMEDMLREILAPFIKAQKETQSLQDGDVHIMFNVVVTRGKGEHNAVLTVLDATSSLPGLLKPNALATACGNMEQMLNMSIVAPIIGDIQQYVSMQKIEASMDVPALPGAFDDDPMSSIQDDAEKEEE